MPDSIELSEHELRAIAAWSAACAARVRHVLGAAAHAARAGGLEAVLRA
ncbi:MULTISPECIES: hypothetical protein [unclassified Geodermatophilus]